MSLPWRWKLWLAAIVLASCVGRALAEPPGARDGDEREPVLDRAPDGDDGPTLPNWKLKTWGGMQTWADELIYFDWRIQRQAVSGHYRLLDRDDRRHAWGTFEQCQEKLAEIRREQQLPPMTGKSVVVLHGLLGTRKRMEKLATYLHDNGGYTVLNVGYPTTRGGVADHAQTLARVLDHLEQIEEVNFVAHSLGNLVVRHYLADQAAAGQPVDPRIKRMVMLGAPNLGAELAEHLVPLDLTGKVAGKSAAELREWSRLAPRLATPECEFGVIAGGQGDDRGRNPLIAGDDDLVVSVASTRLPGARDFRVLPALHATMMNEPRVQEMTLHFLKEGCFETDETRAPIERDGGTGK